jgi:hypothetical protein
MSDDGLCTVRVNRGSHRASYYQPCGRKAVEDGLCSLHLRVRQRREEKNRAWKEDYEFGEAMGREAETLSEALGVKVTANYSWQQSKYTGAFVVPGDWLRAIAKRERR